MEVDLTKAVQPKSDQLNADDLIGGPRTFTIAGVREGSAEQPIVVDLVEYDRPYKPCKSMLRVMIGAWSNDAKAWINKRMTLYCDAEVVFGGVKVGGIRISHMSGIARPMDFMLTATRSKRRPYTVNPLAAATYPVDQFEKNFPVWEKAIRAGKYTANEIIAKCEQKALLTDDQAARVREVEA